MHPHYHACSSAKKWGGVPEDYLAVHEWFDSSKAHVADFRHRALRHHSQGIFEAEERFGTTITNSAGRKVPVRLIGERHVKEDCGGKIPVFAEWVMNIVPKAWMNKPGKSRD